MTGFGREALRGLYALDRPEVHWRHDVDYDPACALLMAELERDCHIRSTFYVMARGPYNPFSLELRKILYGILACGHSLGLHVDLGLPRDAETPAWLLSRPTCSCNCVLVSGPCFCSASNTFAESSDTAAPCAFFCGSAFGVRSPTNP